MQVLRSRAKMLLLPTRLLLRAIRRYDFGYLLKILTCMPLPASETEFFELLNLYFPNIFDIKYMMKFCDNLHGGLNKLAEMLDVQRIGPQHQAGSDRCAGEVSLNADSAEHVGERFGRAGLTPDRGIRSCKGGSM